MFSKLTLLVTLVMAIVFVSTAFGQTYSPMAPPQVMWRWTADCLVDGSPAIVYNCPITISSHPFYYTNAHLHSYPYPPTSTLYCINSYQCASPYYGQTIYANTSNVGFVPFNVCGSLVGQAEYLANTGTAGSTYSDYAIGYTDLHYNDHPEIWVRIGGSETGGGTNHGSTYYNRYMTSNAAYGLYYATYQYLLNNPGITHLCTNDMALPFGGKFDICNAPGLCTNPVTYAPWASPHSQHDRGTAADVAGTASQQCTNAGGSGVKVAEFISACVDHGAYQQYSLNESNHAHCGFSIPSWPH